MDDDTVEPEILLKVQLFGPPRAMWADHPLSISRRQVRALLYRLAADRRPVPCERLCFLFWPDTPESAARRKLTGLVNHLRRTLPEPGLLVTDDDQIRLDTEHTWSDTMAFDRWGTQSSTLEQAVGLYRGPFLDGFSLPDSPEFEMWVALERQMWERRYLEALAALIEVHAAKQEYEAAIHRARDYLAADELAEGIHRRLIELYAAAGDRSSALHQSEDCVAVHEREEKADLPLQHRLPLGDLGAAAAALGDAGLARRCLEESLSISREIADRTQEILCLLHLGWLSIRQKEPVAALEHLRAGLEMAEQVGSCTEQGWLLCGLAEAHLLMGDRPMAKQHAQRALTVARRTGRPYDERLARRVRDRLEQD